MCTLQSLSRRRRQLPTSSRKCANKQKYHVTCVRKQKRYKDDSSSESSDEFDDVMNESRRALSFTRSAVNSPRHLAALVRTSLTCFSYARQHICYSNVHAIARPFVCPSVTRFHGSVKKRLKSGSCDFHRTAPFERGQQTKGWGGENKLFSSFLRQYVENGRRYAQSYY